ncbi:flagellar hook-length control protein FliK, partial [Massilia psychrophila]
SRPLAQLQREPQMQRALTAAAAPEPAQVTAPPGSAPAPAAVDPATAQFINLQLTSQEQGRVAWQGQLLPGQDMAWQISRDPPDTSGHPGAEAETAEPPWRSALRLRFAALGEIGATVVLAGDQLHIALQAGSSDIGSVLHARAGELRRALEASGNPPATLTVSVGAVLDVNPGRARP